MATNPLDKLSLSQAQLENIAGGGTETSGDDSYTADETALYLTPDDSIVITDTAPTTSTAGYVGQFMLIPTAGSEALYICTATGGTYTWKQVTLS